jgi:hypothetical protein
MAAEDATESPSTSPALPSDETAVLFSGSLDAARKVTAAIESTAPPSEHRAASEQAQEAARKRSEDARAAMLGLQGHGRFTNQRRSTSTLRVAAVVMALMIIGFLVFGAMMYSFYQRNIQPQLETLASSSVALHMPRELESDRALANTQSDLAAARTALDKASEQIIRLQRQLDALRAQQDDTTLRMTKMAETMQTGAGTPKSGNVDGSIQVASVVPMTSPVNQELWLLKERNRLTFWADQAIAQGSSDAMTNLWRSMDDPELAKLRDGVQTEIIRVQNYYAKLSRVPPDYRLPVRDLFKNSSLRNEADLSPDQVSKLLLDPQQPFEVRARAAYVLGGRRTPEVARALIQAMKTDPMLDVVKEAQRTLEDDFAMRVPPLHIRAADAWWQQYSAAPASQTGVK